MPGVQQPPRRVDDPDLAALLKHRYGLHCRHPVPADKIARHIAPDASPTAQRNLSAKILRLFRDGVGRSTARWSYFESQVFLGVPADEQKTELEQLAALYRQAFPAATDCLPTHDTNQVPVVPHVAASTLNKMLGNALANADRAKLERDQARAELAATRQERDTGQEAVGQLEALLDHELTRAREQILDAHRDAATAREQADVLAQSNAALSLQLEQLHRVVGDGRARDATRPVATTPVARPVPRPAATSRHRAGNRRRPAPNFDAPLPVSGWVPHGVPVQDWRSRHTLVCWLLAAQLPALAAYAWHLDATTWRSLAAAVPTVLLLLAATRPGTRRLRTVAACAGTLSISLLLALLAGGGTTFLVQYVVVVVLLAVVYEDWTAYLLAVASVPLVEAAAARAGTADPVLGTWPQPGLVTALAAVLLVAWRHNQQARQRAAYYRARLLEGQHSLIARIEETDRIRADLVAMVSHEFRSPLTGLRGALSTLRTSHDRLPVSQVADLVDIAYTSSGRLQRLLENMLTAATANVVDVDDAAVSDLPAVVADTVEALRSSNPLRANRVVVDLPATLPVRMAGTPLRQLVANLLDNAVTHSAPDAPIRVIAGRVGDDVVLRVRNPGPDLDHDTIRDLFEPFRQHDSSTTRTADGAGLGLYVVRQLVEVHGGRLRMASDNGQIIVEVDLKALPVGAPTHAAPDLAPTRLRQPQVAASTST